MLRHEDKSHCDHVSSSFHFFLTSDFAVAGFLAARPRHLGARFWWVQVTLSVKEGAFHGLICIPRSRCVVFRSSLRRAPPRFGPIRSGGTVLTDQQPQRRL